LRALAAELKPASSPMRDPAAGRLPRPTSAPRWTRWTQP